MHDIWRAGGPQIDMLSPDIYLPEFNEIAARYNRIGGPLFVPESRGDAVGAANAFYAIGQLNGIGYSPMGIDIPASMIDHRPGTEATVMVPDNIEDLMFPVAYRVLAQLMPLILEHQAGGTIRAAWLNKDNPMEDIELGGYKISVKIRQDHWNPDASPEVGYAMFIAVGPDEFYVAGHDVQITFQPTTPGPPIAGLAGVEAGRFEDGSWVVTRRLAGDDCVLEYDQAKAAAAKQSGSGLHFRSGKASIQHVELYRYR
jgi:hypothetical protein